MRRFVSDDGGFSLDYPEDWIQLVHEDGVPYFHRPEDDQGGVLRVKLLHLSQGDSTGRLREILGRDARHGAVRLIQLGAHTALHSVERDGQGAYIHHHWIVAEGSKVLAATYTAPRESLKTGHAQKDLFVVIRMLESVNFSLPQPPRSASPGAWLPETSADSRDRLDNRLLGKWVIDPEDEESLRRDGTTSILFRKDGTMTFTIDSGGQENSILLTYHIEDGAIVTDQPSNPREERTEYQLLSDGKLLLLSRAGASSRYLRV